MKKLLLGAAIMLAYTVAVLIPGEWFWFNPGEPVFEDAVAGTDPPLRFSREILRHTSIRYAVLLRRDVSDDPACDAQGGPFMYLPERSGVLVGWTLSR